MNVNLIGNIPAKENDCVTDDNLAVALCTYFESLPECPEDDINTEVGRSQWAMDKTDNLLKRIIEVVSNEKTD